jgi:acyl-CoA synthetase (AMP-forming)/AMP-acid ligase II/thioesterase domain-containing protein
MPQKAVEQVSACLDELAWFARENPDAAAIFSPGNDPLTFAEFEDRIEAVARDLRALGVGRGDIVAVAMPGGPELLWTVLGIMRVTAAALFDASFTASEFRTRLAWTPARCLVTAADSHAAAAARALAMPVVEPSTDPERGLLEALGRPVLPAVNCARASPDTALIVETSATSAAKLVPLTHRNLSSVFDSIRRGLGLRSTDVYLSVMPLHHLLGFVCTVGQLLEGGSVVCAGGFDPLLFASLLVKFQPTWYAGGPALHRAVLQIAKDHPGKLGRSLRFIRCGTAAASPALLDELERTLNVTVVNGYGLTETGPVTNTDPDLPQKPGSVGRSIGPEIGIMDSSGKLLPPGAEGEVVVRGDTVTPGYLGDPDATGAGIHGGWFHTGDLGHRDEEGDLFISGRIKEMINRGGESIAPLEIDLALAEHPAVALAAAFGVSHPTLGEDVGAAIVLRAGRHATEAEIRGFLAAGRLSRARIPSRIVFTDSIPVSAAGKPLRKVLSERFGGSIAESSPPEALTPTERGVAEIWATLLGIDLPGPADNFFSLGGDSLSAARMISRVDEQFRLGGKLWERIEFFDSPTVAALADILTLSPPDEAAERYVEGMSAVFLQSRGDEPPIFFFPGEGMHPSYLRHLVKHLGEKRPFIVLLHELKGADQFDGIAGSAVSLIHKLNSRGPLLLAGHCYGGILAYEVAQRLISAGHSGISVILMDTPAPSYPKIRLRRYFQYVPAAVRTLFPGSLRNFVDEIAGHIRFLRKRPATFGSAMKPAAIILRSYQPKPFSGSLACLNAGDTEVSERVLEDPRLGWRNLSQGPFASRTVADSHASMFGAENASALAHQLQSLLSDLLTSPKRF